ncbi:hypothetical protein BJY52DRAFT_1144222 [Lactarius psammicola]|nr:hypothetical protein BJY52DRAFT_1144222 [Lactarius psammicola]
MNGEVFHVTQLTSLKEKEKSRRQATQNQDPFIPPSNGTPVNNLPNELFSYIFTLGSEAEESGYDEEGQEEEEDAISEHGPHLPFQVLVSHVCRRWRAVAIETPTLWTYLDFSEGPPFDKSRAWLERSKECPLDIELDCTADSDSESESGSDGSEDQADSHISPADLPIVRDLILPHSARWRIFEFIADDFQVMYGILATLASIPEAPELRALRLCHYDDNEDYDRFSPVHLKQPFFAPFCGRAPELGLVTLWGVHVDWETCVFLQGLEELELAYHAKDVRPPYKIFTRILQRSPDLHTLTLSASGPAGKPEEDWPADVIELPSVRQLGLAFIEPSYASALLKRLVFPNLLVLSLDFDTEDYSAFIIEQLASPAPNQRHSLCQNLVDLKLSGIQCSDEALSKFYHALPNLVSLDLNCYHLRPPFFGYLFAMLDLLDPENMKYCLPKLTTLTTSGISGLRMRNLVAERKSIKHVRMDSEAEMEKEDEAWLRAHTESFDFFDGSDDEDDDNTSVGPADLLAESDGEGDGVPGEWVDDDDDSIE